MLNCTFLGPMREEFVDKTASLLHLIAIPLRLEFLRLLYARLLSQGIVDIILIHGFVMIIS